MVRHLRSEAQALEASAMKVWWPMTFARTRRWMLSIVLIAVAGGFAYEQISAARDRRELTQIGQSIDIGDRSLNIFCSGTGTPAVVFESGAGLPGYSWVFIQREIAKVKRSCWYDRAGSGWSDSRPDPNWSDLAAEDLHKLLDRADVRPPYVLVGHSLGGLTARVYQAMYPDDVAGMVMLDPADEATSSGGGSIASRLPAPVSWALVYVARALAHVGVVRLFAVSGGTAPAGVTQPEWNTIACLRNQPKVFLASIRGGPNVEQVNVERIRAVLNGKIGDIPLKVLQPVRAAALRKQRLAAMARRSSGGEHILVPNTGHMIHWDAPDVVIKHVRDVLVEIER